MKQSKLIARMAMTAAMSAMTTTVACSRYKALDGKPLAGAAEAKSIAHDSKACPLPAAYLGQDNNGLTGRTLAVVADDKAPMLVVTSNQSEVQEVNVVLDGKVSPDNPDEKDESKRVYYQAKCSNGGVIVTYADASKKEIRSETFSFGQGVVNQKSASLNAPRRFVRLLHAGKSQRRL